MCALEGSRLLQSRLDERVSPLTNGLRESIPVMSALLSLARPSDAEAHLVQPIEHIYRRRPVDTRVCDRHTVLQRSGSLRRHILPSGVYVRLNHDTDDVAVPSAQLLTDRVDDLRLVVVVLLGVPIYSTMRQDIHKCPSMHFDQRTTHDCSQS